MVRTPGPSAAPPYSRPHARRPAVRACILLLLATTPALLRADQAPQPPRPVRSSTRWGIELIEDGVRRSAAFRTLVDRLFGTGVIVYVEPVTYLPPQTDAVTQFGGVAGPFRYLRVSLRARAERVRLIALLGHELQHVFEVSQSPAVVSVQSFEALYRRIGDTNEAGYDTSAARRAGDRVMTELMRSEASGAPGDQSQTPGSGVRPPGDTRN